MRFWNFSGWSLSNDELSAWVRLQYDSAGEVMEKGVRPDFHPAGVQMFLYAWTGIFGDSPFALRLPFVIFGILGLWFSWLTAKKWFGQGAALMSLSLLSVLQVPLLYSQVARPYSSGFFLIMAFAYFWSRLLVDRDRSWKTLAGFIVFGTLCLYDHYFCGVVAGFAGLSGLFFLKRDNYRAYLVCGFIIILSFLPHTGISLDQIARGGLSSWLGPPGENYLWKFLFHNIYDSLALLTVLSAMVVAGIFAGGRSGSAWKSRIIFLMLFSLPYTFAWWYSTYRNPILQYSILIFCLPFLGIFLFSFVSELWLKWAWLGSLVLLGTGAAVAVTEGKFYSKQHFGVFKELAEKSLEWDERYGKQNITRVYNLIAHDYIDYYFRDKPYKPEYTFLRGDGPGFLSHLDSLVSASNSRYFIYGWSNNAHPDEAYDIILLKYDILDEMVKYNNSNIAIFSATTGRSPELLLGTTGPPASGIVNRISEWPSDTLGQLISDMEFYPLLDTIAAHLFDTLPTLSFRAALPVSGRFAIDSHNLVFKQDSSLNIRFNELFLVAEIRRQDSIILWAGNNFGKFSVLNSRKPSGKWHDEFHWNYLTISRPQNILHSDRIKVYFWNKDKVPFPGAHFMIYHSPYLNLLYEK